MTPPLNPAAPPCARVLVVDDHPIFREGLAELINRQPRLTCCGQIAHAREVLDAVKRLSPDLLLLDLRLGDGDGLDLLPRLKRLFPKLPVLVLSQADEELYAERALRAGASGYIMKEEATEEVVKAIGTVLSGIPYVSRQQTGRLMATLVVGHSGSKGTGIASLANRELQVFRLLGEGLSPKSIAEQLSISIKTVQTHRENIKHKLNLPNGSALVRHATTWVEEHRHAGTPGWGDAER
jgi:DNA-binding NarL/FixJ family response regulator